MDTTPIWWPVAHRGNFHPLRENISVDVAIIGAGITGITLAHRLKESGRTVAVLEMQSVGMGATGSSTGHLTSALDIDYATLQRKFGHGGASEAATRSQAAIQHIEDLVTRYGIDCQFERVDGWRYVEDANGGALEAELPVARAAGLQVELVDRGPLPFMRQALRFAHQAMFNPVQYVEALARRVDGDGCHIFEETRVTKVIAGSPCLVETDRYVVTAEDVVHATHTPVAVVLPMQRRIAPYTTHVIAVRLNGPLPMGMYWDTLNPYHYIRPAKTRDGTPVLLVGGEDHRTGEDTDLAARFAALTSYARQRFPVAAVVAQWADEIFEPVDGLPYIGHLDAARHVYCATGFSGTGLTFGATAALEISDLIFDAERPPSVFRPERYTPVASAANFLRENANVAWRKFRDRFHGPGGPRVDEIPPGEGRITEIEGKSAAVYRAPNGRVYALSPVCPHAGGIVRWNATACTWDCPLHGSRFSATGDVHSGPACTRLGLAESLKPGEEPAVTDVILDYELQGYTCKLVARSGARLECPGCGFDAPASEARIEAFHRFEGMSDPDDMCVVLATRLPLPDGSDCRGVLVLGFGPGASPEEKEMFAALEFDSDARDVRPDRRPPEGWSPSP